MLDSYDILDPGDAAIWCEDQGYTLCGLPRYLFGAETCLAEEGDGGYVLTPGTADWLAICAARGLKVPMIWELSAYAAEGGAAQAQQDAPIAIACVNAVLSAKVDVSIFGPGGPNVFVTNDSVVTNLAAVEAYFAEFAALLKAASDVPDEYGQASVYTAVKGSGIEYLWKAPDGTDDVPAGTLWIQQYPEVTVYGDQCDLDILTDEGVALWVTPPAPPKPTVEDEHMIVLTTDPVSKGMIVLDLANGQFYGLSDEAVAAYYESCKVPTAPEPSTAVFAKFHHVGTI